MPVEECFVRRGRGGDDDCDGGLPAWAVALVGLGGLAIGYLLGSRNDDDDDEAAAVAAVNPMPEGQTAATAVRLVPSSKEVEVGGRAAFDLQARSKEDGKWYSVTGSTATSLNVVAGNEILVQQDGAKNGFYVPITASDSANGKSVTVSGTYAPEGGKALSAETTIRVRVSTEETAVEPEAVKSGA